MPQRKGNRASSITELWNAINSWLSERGDVELPSPASDDEIASAESTFSIQLPGEVRASYRIHDGSGPYALIPFGEWKLTYPLLSLTGMVNNWKLIQDGVRRGAFSGPDFVNHPSGPIQQTWFHERWIPLVDDQCGDYYFLDLAPARGGRRGQVIVFLRESGATNVIASSFGELMAMLVADLEADRYTFKEKERALVAKAKKR